MDVKQLIGAVSALIVKIVVVVVAVMFIFKFSVAAYDFGFQLFADIPVTEGDGRTVSVVVSEQQDAKDIGKLLEEKGLIRDWKLFYIQEKVSDYKGNIKPGTYELNTAMNIMDMLKLMCNVEEVTE